MLRFFADTHRFRATVQGCLALSGSLGLVLAVLGARSVGHAQSLDAGQRPTVVMTSDASVTDANQLFAIEPIVDDPADDRVAVRVLGTPAQDQPDPTGDEGDAAGSAEGEPLPASPQVAHEIAALSDRQCLSVLRRAGVAWSPSGRVQRGISQPIFINGPIGGVTFRGSGTNPRTIHEIMDCRLAVALLRWSRQLRALSIREVVHLSIYRPATESAVQRQPVQTRHPGAMAIDAGVFVRDDGTIVSVLDHFRGHLGRPVCGPEARVPRDDRARLLRTIACDSARRGLFHVVLTPNFNEPHRNHFHLEVTRNVSWQYVR